MGNIIRESFYLRNDVVQIARDLLGKVIVTQFDNHITSGMIVETEAYAGVTDKASHAWSGRKTKRTEIMFRSGGIAYVYLCYGIHSLFNVVTNREGIPHAVLIRGIVPMDGRGVMLSRSGKDKITGKTGIGPGKVSKLLGIDTSHTGFPICKEKNSEKKLNIWMEERGNIISDSMVEITPRIGVNYAEEDAGLPYRFLLNNKTLK